MPIVLILVTSIFALAVAYISQYGFGFEPCVLCYYQRIPYFAVIVLSLLSLSIRMADHRNIQICIGLIFCISAFLAFNALQLSICSSDDNGIEIFKIESNF